jgi:hypothetical protein
MTKLSDASISSLYPWVGTHAIPSLPNYLNVTDWSLPATSNSYTVYRNDDLSFVLGAIVEQHLVIPIYVIQSLVLQYIMLSSL